METGGSRCQEVSSVLHPAWWRERPLGGTETGEKGGGGGLHRSGLCVPAALARLSPNTYSLLPPFFQLFMERPPGFPGWRQPSVAF